MKHIELKKLTLQNFKGVVSQEINLSNLTVIEGANGSGKTTLFDAFTWLLFGKDSRGVSDTKFGIKTKDSNNSIIPQIEHSVTAELEVDGTQITVSRTLREKWVKKRGALEAEFSGNETVYAWNDVPVSKREYESKIADVLDEKVFKLITDPMAFTGLHWESQREVLLQLTGNITNADTARGITKFEQLMAKLTGKTLEEYRKELAAKRRKLTTEIKQIPVRIDEVQKSMPRNANWDALQKTLEESEQELAENESLLRSAAEANAVFVRQKQTLETRIHEVNLNLKTITEETRRNLGGYEAAQEQHRLERDLDASRVRRSEHRNHFTYWKDMGESHRKVIEKMEKDIERIRQQWIERNAQEFQPNTDFSCNACGQEIPEDQAEARKVEAERKFNKDKALDLQNINDMGKSLAERLSQTQELYQNDQKSQESYTKYIEEELKIEKELVAKIDQLKKFHATRDIETELVNSLMCNTKYNDLKVEQEKLENELRLLESPSNDDTLKKERTSIKHLISQIESRLRDKELIGQSEERIQTLKDKERTLAQEIAMIEKEEFIADDFITAKTEMMEQQVNQLFTDVRFKLFEKQVNGADVPTCKATYKGVDFDDVNSAGKITVGLDIINTLCEHYQVTAPIFIDNAESITEIPSTKSQQIRLFVKEGATELMVNNYE